MPFGPISAAIGITSIGSSILGGLDERRRSKRIGRRGQRLEDIRVRIQEQQGLRSRRNLVREASIKGGAAAGAAGARGINVGSSAVLQAQASIAAQLASGINFQREQQDLRDQETRAEGSLQRAGSETTNEGIAAGVLGAFSTGIGAFG